tara:strand:- start:784 stop:1497 length:714 start_codon:yes stop_codon:yes gene_type:complete
MNMNKFFKKLKNVNGQSLAEFAVTTAMMATLATTAAPKFSGVGEGAKEKKTLADIDKILKAANNFYNTEVTESGRGRFPGQSKFDQNVPEGGGYGYTDNGTDIAAMESAIAADLTDENANFLSYNSSVASKWVSVFGFDNPDAAVLAANQSQVVLNRTEDPVDGTYPGESGYDLSVGNGSEEFLDLFGGEAIKSPFQDGHYIYTVVGGSGSGSQSSPPIIFVADLESPANFFKKLQP